MFLYGFFILICFQPETHGTYGVSKILKSFLCLLSFILQCYSIKKLEFVLFYSLWVFFMWVLLYLVISVAFNQDYSFVFSYPAILNWVLWHIFRVFKCFLVVFKSDLTSCEWLYIYIALLYFVIGFL